MGPVNPTSASLKVLIVQEFGVLPRLPKSIETEVEVLLNHLFAWIDGDDMRLVPHI